MTHHERAERPAALPVFLFVIGLALSTTLGNPAMAIAGTLGAAILAGRLFGNVRLGLMVGSLALGLAVGTWRQEESRALRDILSRSERDRFVTVEVPMEGSWSRTGTGHRISASRFVSGERVFASPITIYLSAQPEFDHRASRLRVEGLLRRSENGRLTLSCKSSRLIHYSGQAPRLHPRWWNRRADQKLGELALARPELIRVVALAKALALGRSDELTPDLREDYRRGGTYHLLVFSGMQIAFAAAVLSSLARWRGRPWVGDLTLLLLAFFAPLFAGNEPSVTRAALMIGIYAGSRLLARPTSLENLFFVSALARLAIRPGELTDPGFLLTYAATGGLLFIGRPLAKLARNRVTAALLYGIGAEVATLPLTLFFFHQYVLGGSIVTLLLAPLLAVMLAVAAAACAVVFLSPAAASLTLGLLALLDQLATATNLFFGDTLGLSRVAAAPPVSVMVLAYAVSFLLVQTRRGELFSSMVLLVPVLFALTEPLRNKVTTPTLDFLDVGQGDAILMRSRNFSLVVDGGGRREDVEFGRRVLLPKLADRGVTHIDAVLLSHPHPDHCGGLPAVFENFDVSEFWLAASHLREGCAAELANLAFERRIPVRLIRDGTAIKRQDVTLHFSQAGTRFKRAGLNNSSVVLNLRAGSRSFLLTGDIEREAEAELVDSAALGADVLKVPHHGSRGSTTPELIDAVRPRIAIISAGRRNPFGHPHPTVTKRLKDAGVRVLRTDRNGDVRVEVRASQLVLIPQIDTPRSAP